MLDFHVQERKKIKKDIFLMLDYLKNADIIRYKSEIANIDDSVNKSISNYNLESLNINSI